VSEVRYKKCGQNSKSTAVIHTIFKAHLSTVNYEVHLHDAGIRGIVDMLGFIRQRKQPVYAAKRSLQTHNAARTISAEVGIDL